MIETSGRISVRSRRRGRGLDAGEGLADGADAEDVGAGGPALVDALHPPGEDLLGAGGGGQVLDDPPVGHSRRGVPAEAVQRVAQGDGLAADLGAFGDLVVEPGHEGVHLGDQAGVFAHQGTLDPLLDGRPRADLDVFRAEPEGDPRGVEGGLDGVPGRDDLGGGRVRSSCWPIPRAALRTGWKPAWACGCGGRFDSMNCR